MLLPYMIALTKRGEFDIMKKVRSSFVFSPLMHKIKITEICIFLQLVGTYKPEQMAEALKDMKSGKVVKPVIVW